MSQKSLLRSVRCRFAPSPTGNLHVGGARTALFNYLFARKHGGVHILRIEDTDRERSTDEAIDAIMDGLNWLEIPFDEGPFFQSKRLSLYHQYAKKLLLLGAAYPCTCTTERLDQLREEQRIKNEKPQYDRLHRPKVLSPQSDAIPKGDEKDPFVIRLAVPEEGDIVFHDAILGEIRTSRTEIDDFIILRSDGTPTYNFTVVVDDIEMQISHVIRGMDHISNTPKQLVIYHALQALTPVFGHVPMILGSDKKKLSKRHGATSVFEYKKEGYLPDAFINYLARLGWSHGDQEIFSRGELESFFSLETIGKSPAVFDLEKLSWVNAEHMKTLPSKKLAEHLAGYLQEQGFSTDTLLGTPVFLKLVESLKERTKTLKEMADNCRWFFLNDIQIEFDEKAKAKHLTAEVAKPLSSLIEKLNGTEDFVETEIEARFQEVLQEHGVTLVKIAQPVRVAVTGTAVSPPIYTVLEILGKERTLNRLKRALASINV